MMNSTSRQAVGRASAAPGRKQSRFRKKPRIDAADVIAVHVQVGRAERSRRDADLAETLAAIRRRTA